jgi:hypothetical protein
LLSLALDATEEINVIRTTLQTNGFKKKDSLGDAAARRFRFSRLKYHGSDQETMEQPPEYLGSRGC